MLLLLLLLSSTEDWDFALALGSAPEEGVESELVHPTVVELLVVTAVPLLGCCEVASF